MRPGSTRLCALAALALVLAGPATALADPFDDDVATLSRCDDARLLDAVRTAIAHNIQMTVRSVSSIRTVSRTNSAATCTLHAVATSGEEDDVTYTLTLRGGGTDFLVTDVTQTRPPNRPAP